MTESDQARRSRFGEILGQLIAAYGGGSPGKLVKNNEPNPPYAIRTIQDLVAGRDERITSLKLLRVSSMLGLPRDALEAIYENDAAKIKRLAFDDEAARQFILDRMGAGSKVPRSRGRATGS